MFHSVVVCYGAHADRCPSLLYDDRDPFMDVVVTVDVDRLMMQQTQKQGFPTASSPVPPRAPPAPFVFYARDA